MLHEKNDPLAGRGYRFFHGFETPGSRHLQTHNQSGEDRIPSVNIDLVQ